MNQSFKRVALAAALSIGAVGLATADQWDKKTTITIDEQMKIPNAVLQPGTYVVKLADLGAQRHIVQFFEKDGIHLITTVLAIPNERLRPTGKSVFRFWEVPSGQPQALRAWFYPGDNFGQEFAYPKTEADVITSSNAGATVPVDETKPVELAKSAPVDNDDKAKMDRDDKVKADMDRAKVDTDYKTATAAAVTPAPTPEPVAAAAPAPVVIATPAQEPVVVAAAEPPPARNVVAAAAPASAPETLPQTASDLPLLAMVGLGALLMAAGVNFAYNRA